MIYPVNNIAITKGYHKGKSLDFGWWGGHHQNIISCGDGKVYLIQKQPKGGNVIYIEHKNNIISAYAHLQSICVKKGQKVKLGQKIGTMGATGVVSAEHLHFGLYTKGKNLGGNADLDPFKYCLVYPNQKVCKNKNYYTYKDKIKYYDDSQVWKVGEYRLLKEKALRKTHNLTNNVYKVKECDKIIQKYLTSKKPNDKAILTTKETINIVEIFTQGKRVWGRMNFKKPYWLVLCNLDGTPQANRIS